MDEAYQPTWEINFCDQLFVKILPKQDNDQQQASSPHCSCLIEVSFSTTQWIVERSPNDFCYLQQKLAKYLPDNLIQLLPVGLEGINEEVLKLYENFLVSLIKHPQSWKISTLAQFLDDEKKIIYRFWASERIQELTVSSAPLSLSSDLSKEVRSK